MLTGAAHGAAWPVVRGGTQRLAGALASYLRAPGGELESARPIRRMEDVPTHRAAPCDGAPEHPLEIVGDRLGDRYRSRVFGFRRGAAVFKIDYALSGPVPWTAEECSHAGTVHLAGSLDEMVESERAVANGRIPASP